VESVEDLYHCLKKGISFVAFRLKRLDLSSRRITDPECKLLAEVLRSNRSITSLNLSKNTIHDAGFIALCSTLNTNTTLKTLIFASNLVSSKAYIHMGHALKVNTTLTSLSLASHAVSTKMNKEGVSFICEGLETNTTLERLWLGGNHLCDDGIQILAKLLKKNYTLTELSLQNNSIGQGYKDIAALLESNHTLTSLDLGDNPLTGHCNEISRSLAANKTLTYLNLRHCEINSQQLQTLCEGFKANRTITHLDLGRNNFDPESGAVLADLLQVRSFSQLILRGAFEGIVDLGVAYYDALKIAQITCLDLGYTLLPSECVANILKYNTTVQDLNLDGISLANQCEQIFKALKFNNTLLRLSLMNVGMNNKDFDAIALLKENQTLTNLTLGVVAVAPGTVLSLVENLAENYSLTNLTTFHSCKHLSKLLKRNKQFQKDMRLKTMMIIYNIARSADAFQIFPPEVWFLILKYVRYPGVGGFDLIAREVFANPFKIIVRAKRDDKIALEKEMT